MDVKHEVTEVMAGIDTEQAATLQRFAKERGQFRALLLANPNYFGTLKVSPFPPVLNIQANPTYEEICSVGFQPQFNRLEAVVHVKQPSGYGGGVCSSGTPEYVRFYISYNNGATWDDAGVTSFTAFDIPEGTVGPKKLHYAVSLDINPPRKWCTVPNLARVRAILSWNDLPPAGSPDYIPVWGDIHNTTIQVEPRRLFLVKDLIAQAKLPKDLLDTLDLSQQLQVADPKPLPAVELHKLYRDKGVEPHRFALTEMQALIAKPSLTLASPELKLPGLDIDWADIVGKLFPTDGDTRYEELECIGLDPNQDVLAGVVRVKLPNGYNGGPCTAGSREYVAFWADFNDNGTFETYLGTTSVTVYDVNALPNEGLEYGVFLPVNLAQYRQPCSAGPKVVKIRAILSWNVAPPPGNPNYVPVWGNREEGLIHIKPGPSVQPGTHVPFIETAGSMHVDDISSVTGLANGTAALAGFTADDSPFGGEVILTGHIAYPPDISSGAAPLKYRVWVRKVGDPWQKVDSVFGVGRSQLLNGVWSTLPDATQATDVDGFYEYREDLAGGPGNAQIYVVGNVLARWQTGGLNGLWQIVIEAKESGGGSSWYSNMVALKLDNVAPTPALTITTGGGNCADFTVGDVIGGTYSVSDEHFRSFSLGLQPANGGVFTPAAKAYPVVPTAGEAGAWTLDTTGLPRCGYVVVLGVLDRTIVNSGHVGHYNQAVVGLCLREVEE